MSAPETVVVETKCGPVRGIHRKSCFGDKFIGFQGIPYGKPPVNELRFKDPQEPEPWSRILDATKQCQSAFGINQLLKKPVGSEDCLRINVFTKEINPKTPLPVMVYIHGGAFMRGSSGEEMYGPDYFMSKNVVLISFNYRLGALGFLSVNDPKFEIPGNAGLKDQRLALKWVCDNVSKFGGDPKNITLFGESAGGCSVHYHMVSEFSKGLFHKAIVMSGTALNNWSVVPMSNWAERLATQMGWNGSNGDEGLVEFLRKASANDIVLAQEKLITPEELEVCTMFPFGPVIEPYVGEQCLIPKNPVLMVREAWSKDIPIIIGGNSEEGLFRYRDVMANNDLLNKLNSCEAMVPLELFLSKGSDKSKEIAKTIKEMYFGEEEPSMSLLDGYTDLNSDKLFWHGIHRAVLSRLSLSTAPTFFYRFNYDGGEFNAYKTLFAGKGIKGSCHADDLSYLFKHGFNQKMVYNSNAHKTIQRMVGAWTSFAITGSPNCDEIKPIVWKPLPNSQPPFKCLNISDELSIIDLPESKRMAAWDSFYPNSLLY